MKKVLIIGYFRPYRRGSRRVLGLAKCLRELGWEPIILTGPLKRKPEFNVRYIETEHRNFLGIKTKEDLGDQLKEKNRSLPPGIKSFLKLLFNFLREILAYPDENKYWRPFAVKEANKLLEKEKIDAIISIWPVIAHLIAKELKEKYKIPWIADFPDLWAQNYCYAYSPIRRFFDRRLELRTIELADVLTTISQPFIEKLKGLHKEKEIHLITHGFDPQKVNNHSYNLTSKFTITYTGQIYTGKQDPSKILISLKDLIEDGTINRNDVELRFYGPERNWLEKKIEKYGLSDVIKQYGVVSQEVSFKKQWESQILLFLNWEDENQKGVYTGKIFEYLAAWRPILSSGGTASDVVEDLLKETKAGSYCPTVEDIKKTLKKFYSEYKETGEVKYMGDIEKINKYSHREMAKKFADILNQLI